MVAEVVQIDLSNYNVLCNVIIPWYTKNYVLMPIKAALSFVTAATPRAPNSPSLKGAPPYIIHESVNNFTYDTPVENSANNTHYFSLLNR